MYVGILFAFIVLTGLSLPKQAGMLQSTPEPTTTLPALYLPGEEPLKSGETGGLILGALVILVIIVTGVLIQRVLQKKSPDFPE